MSKATIKTILSPGRWGKMGQTRQTGRRTSWHLVITADEHEKREEKRAKRAERGRERRERERERERERKREKERERERESTKTVHKLLSRRFKGTKLSCSFALSACFLLVLLFVFLSFFFSLSLFPWPTWAAVAPENHRCIGWIRFGLSSRVNLPSLLFLSFPFLSIPFHQSLCMLYLMVDTSTKK